MNSKPETRNSKLETITVTDTVAAVTEKAILLKSLVKPFQKHIAVSQDGWIPKSLIKDSDADLDEIEEGDEITIEIPEWLARQKGLAD